jgi:hypothetical protein
MAGPYPPQYGVGPIGHPPPYPGPPQPYPENSIYPGALPPPIPYPSRRKWPWVLGALLAVAALAAAVAVTAYVVHSDDRNATDSITAASAKSAIQNYLDALQRGDVETIARHTLCGLFDAVKQKRSDLALADLSSDAFRKQFSKADVTSIDKMVFAAPNQAQVLFTMSVSPAGTRTQPPPQRDEQAVAQLLAQGDEVLVCSYLLRAGQY